MSVSKLVGRPREPARQQPRPTKKYHYRSAVRLIRRSAELFFPFNPHLSCGHPLPLPRARKLAEKELFCGTFSRRRSVPDRPRPNTGLIDLIPLGFSAYLNSRQSVSAKSVFHLRPSVAHPIRLIFLHFASIDSFAPARSALRPSSRKCWTNSFRRFPNGSSLGHGFQTDSRSGARDAGRRQKEG